jgi:DNA-binding transcriptional ArsR family regulator
MLDVTVIEDAGAAEICLDPVRARLLAELAVPGSATTLAATAGIARQKVNYQLKVLERHGLVELVEERCRPVPMISSSRRLVVRSKASRVLTQPESCGTARRAGQGAPPVLRPAGRPPGARPAAARADWDAIAGTMNPDGDADLADELVTGFRVVDCLRCGGILKPNVIFFGENVPRDRVAECFALTQTASLLLVLGSSLTVHSGYRFVRRATGLGIPVAIINHGRTRGDADPGRSARAGADRAGRPRPIPPARAARPQKITRISIFVDCCYSG